ncbi:Hypothetical predicted protein [Mytilus galloprovincialis]|uniref:LRAT domain-containing protein n=1 Tax=Mytilus galloprovincialis TaxID=29158 RepID=A0A8B6CDP8_MYTGA|nr:Hypothetical predicted protein [Mytilus galloprovincialis]
MYQQVRANVRQHAYSESSNDGKYSDDDSSSDDKQVLLHFLKNNGTKYADELASTFSSTERNNNHCHPGEINFNTLINEGSCCIEDVIEHNEIQSGLPIHGSDVGTDLHSEEMYGEIATEDRNNNYKIRHRLQDSDLSNLEGRQEILTAEDFTTKVDCFNCANVSRLTDGNLLAKGSHVKFGRYSHSTKTNDFLKRRLKGKFGFPYFHHAIVTDIFSKEFHKISICVVNFTTKTDIGKVNIEVIEERLDINLEEEYLFLVEYKYLSFTADEIIARAKSLRGSRSYNLFTNNCEHVAVWCVTNIKVSFQSDNSGDLIQSWFTWFAAMLAKIVHLSSVSNDIVSATKLLFLRVASCSKVTAGTLGAVICCPILCAIVECILLIRRFKQLKDQLKRRLICLSCFSKKRIRILAKLVVGFTVSIALIMPTLKYAIPVIGIGIIALVVIPWACEKLITKIKAKINPTSVIPKMIVHSMSDIQPGDVLTVYKGITGHDVVVEKVKLMNRQEGLNIESIGIVHYAFCGLLGTRTVRRDTVNINLNTDKLFVYDFPEEKTFSSDTVAVRAMKKIGEQKFNMFNRRSSHLAWDCKVLPNVNACHTRRPVKTVKEVHKGDIIEFRYCALPHVAVAVEPKDYIPADIIELSYIHVARCGEIKRTTEIFDLEISPIFFHIYKQNEIEDNNTVVDNAQRVIGRRLDKNCNFYKSSNFVLACKLKSTNEVTVLSK